MKQGWIRRWDGVDRIYEMEHVDVACLESMFSVPYLIPDVMLGWLYTDLGCICHEPSDDGPANM